MADPLQQLRRAGPVERARGPAPGPGPDDHRVGLRGDRATGRDRGEAPAEGHAERTRHRTTGRRMISVIVPVHDTGRYLERVLAAVGSQEPTRNEVEWIFVDNGSRDGSGEILDAHPGVRVLRESEPGAYAARNRGIREARGEILAFTDSDCFPEPGWLRAVEGGLGDPAVEVLLGPRVPPVEGHWLRLIAEYENQKVERVCASDDPALYFGHTNNMAVRRTAMDRFGPFASRARGSDTIFVRSVVEALSSDAVAYEPSMMVQHAELDSLGVYFGKIRTYGRSRKTYQHITTVRPLDREQRLEAFRAATGRRRTGRRPPAAPPGRGSGRLAPGRARRPVGPLSDGRPTAPGVDRRRVGERAARRPPAPPLRPPGSATAGRGPRGRGPRGPRRASGRGAPRGPRCGGDGRAGPGGPARGLPRRARRGPRLAHRPRARGRLLPEQDRRRPRSPGGDSSSSSTATWSQSRAGSGSCYPPSRSRGWTWWRATPTSTRWAWWGRPSR